MAITAYLRVHNIHLVHITRIFIHVIYVYKYIQSHTSLISHFSYVQSDIMKEYRPSRKV